MTYRRNRHLTLDSVDFTPHLTSLRLTQTRSEQENTKQGAANRTVGVGMLAYEMEAEVEQDRSTGSVHLTLNAIMASGGAVTGTAKPDNDEAHSYSGSWHVLNYEPITSGDVDDVDLITFTLKPAGDITVTTA